MHSIGSQPNTFRKPQLVIAAICALLVLTGIFLYQWRLKEVSIRIGDQTTIVSSFSATVGDLLSEQDIQLASQDAVNFSESTVLTEGMEIVITRAFFTDIRVGNEESFRIITLPGTVENLLKNAGVELGSYDQVQPDLNEVITRPQQITVVTVAKEILEETQEIPFKTEIKKDPGLERGLKKTVQLGQNGQELIRWEVTYENGKEISRQELGRESVRKPQNRVVLEGNLQLASRGGRDLRFERVVSAMATAYTHTGNLTYTDTKPAKGTIAVDPTVIPLGTRLFVDGYGYGKAEDIGSAIKGNKIDLFFETEQDALKWGRKTVRVYILE